MMIDVVLINFMITGHINENRSYIISQLIPLLSVYNNNIGISGSM